ncbi:MAG: RagB/SusD family nutrient uptake outer membrane protein, partial [Alistipes sp.]|nr:RagB/SusD family nutrient uptake outer membrane protein [Alistipes sp.]
MKNTIKYILILCAAPVLLSSCLKEEFPHNGYVTNEQIANSDSGLDAATKAMISWMGESMTIYEEHWDFGFPAVCMAMDALTCDVAIEDYGYDNGCLYWRACLDLEDTGSLPYFVWMYMYRMINLSNNVLLTMNTSGNGSDIESLSATARRAIGQSLAYRALSYLYLARVYEYKGSLSGAYSGLTVPYIDQYTTESEARYNERLPHDEMYENVIVRDLTNALKYLDGYTREKKSQIDQSVVYGLLARTYLQMEKWTEAAEAARKAIDLSGARMLTEAEWTNTTTGFNSLSNTSWLWGVEVTSDDRTVKTGICNWVSMLAPEATFGYSGADSGRSAKLIDVNLYNKIPDTDCRKQSWLDPDRSKYNYKTNLNAAWLESVPAYTGIKLRPANG